MRHTTRSTSLRLAGTALALALSLAAGCTDNPMADPGGPDTAKTRVTVPSAPQGVQAVGGDARATVSWTAPARNGGRAILSYRVTAAPGGAWVDVAAPTTSMAFAGLTNGTTYTFTVTATNSVGTSARSLPSNAVTPQPAPVNTGGRWISGYYVGYQRSLLPPDQIDFSLMTHIIVGRVVPQGDGTLLTHFDITDTQGPAFARDVSARARAAGKKSLLMVGGEGTHAAFVSAASVANRDRFVANLLATMDTLGYDGIDVDWEPIQDVDKPALLWLLQELRARRPEMLITVPVDKVSINFPATADSWYAQAAAVVDQMNVMSYSMSGPWPGWEIWHHSPLNDAATYRPVSISSTVQRYLSVGVPAAKLGIGLGFYGSCWRGAYHPREPQTSTTAFIAGDNAMSYTNIMASYFAGAARRWDTAAGVPYLTFAAPTGPQGCTFVSYEDEQSIGLKGEFVRAQGLGGTIIWTLAQGHVPTAPLGSRDPLLKAAHTAIIAQ